MTTEQFIKGQLAAIAHREGAHHGGIDNMTAVAFVIRNRVRAGWFGGSWMLNIANAGDFSAVICPPSVPDLREMNFRMFLAQVDDIFSGLAVDRMTEGALFYAELHRIERDWFKQNILAKLEEHPRVANVGQVAFFK